MIVWGHLVLVQFQLASLFLNDLSLVKQGTHKYVGWLLI